MMFLSPAISARLAKHHRLIEWVRLFAGYSFVQALAQGIGFISGILVVRTLRKEDYACFMIVNTIGPVMDLLSDNGITNSLAAIGGKFYQDNERMGSLVKTAMLLRRRLVWLSFLIVTPVLIWMLWRNHATVVVIAWIVPITLVGVFFQLNVGVLNVVMNLRQQVRRMQALVFLGVLPRLALIGVFTALGWLSAPLAVAASTVALASQFFLLQHWVKPQISWNAPPNEEFRRDIFSIVKRQAPLTIYFCIQSQIGVWLISIFGNVHRVAEVGALGRIGMIFTILVSTTFAIVIPRFARSQDAAHLRSRYFMVILGFAAIVLMGAVFSWLLPAPLLWLLGSQYSQLGDVVWLSVLAAGVSAWAGVLYHLNVNRGWIPPAWIVIPAEILTQVGLCVSLDLSSVRGILLIGVIGPLTPGIINLIVGVRQLNSMSRMQKAVV